MPDCSTNRRGAVLVTGSSTGIGQACARYLDKLQFRVFAGVRRDADGEALRQKASDRLTPIHIDVTDGATIAAARAAVESAVGEAGLAGLVNNAGIVVPGPLEILPLEELRKQLEVNVVGQLAVTQAFLPLLRRGGGRVVQMGSISGRIATPFVGAYSVSKFALEAMTDALRMELLPWGIEVSIVEPGSIATPIWGKSREYSGEIARRIPLEKRNLYRRAYDAMRAAAAKTGEAGIPAIEVAKAVADALTAPKPRTRYLVGKDAKMRALLAQFIPDRMRDRIIIKHLGLPSTP